jgi:nucleoside-diphosphate kinase
MDRTLVLVKPDGVRRRLIGEVISRIEQRPLNILAIRMLTLREESARELYAEHSGKPFFSELVSFVTSGPVVAIAVEGQQAVELVRALIGATDPKKADRGTIRGDFGGEITENIVHGSDSPESAKRELDLFFPDL